MRETELLRALLDGHGVECLVRDGGGYTLTQWRGREGHLATFTEHDDGSTFFVTDTGHFTAQQAVDATLGRGECEMRSAEGSFCSVNRPVYHCECGAFCTDYTDATTYHKPRYCPNCGKAVKR